MLCHANLMLNQRGMRRAENKRKAKENMGSWGRGPNDKRYGKEWDIQCLITNLTLHCFLLVRSDIWPPNSTSLIVLMRVGGECNITHSNGRCGWGILKQIGHIQVHGILGWDASLHADGAGQCHCKAMLCHIWKIMVIRGGSWWPQKGKHCTCLQGQKAGCGELETNQPHLCGKVMEQVLLKAISRDMKNRMTWNSQHGFTKGRSCLIIPVAFCNEVSGCVDKGQSSGCCVPLARPLI